MGRKLWLPRRLIQFGLFLLGGKWLAVGFLRCPFAVPFVSCTSCPLAECPGRWLQPFYIAGILVLGFFTGRGFCGWACPMGFVQDALGAASKPRATQHGCFQRADRILKWLKWPALLFALWAYWHLTFTAPGRPYPYIVRSDHYLSPAPLRVASSLGDPAYAVRYVLFAVAIVGGLVVSRFWCRYLCPLGALLGLLNKASIFKLGIVPERCTRCHACLRACPMDTGPSTIDCTMCTDCINECEQGAIVGADRLKRMASWPEEQVEEPLEPVARPGEERMDLL
ncbi:MAG: 4Fe-4S binding protein [Armatimonadetes bacterium]|nr:4Fe-4S binding protein [Armatimonadota bacterium]